MSYKNAREVLPAELLCEIQKYCGGELLYVPMLGELEKSGWGQRNGTRRAYDERNRRIRAEYALNVSCEELAARFCLSIDSIRKIVRTTEKASRVLRVSV